MLEGLAEYLSQGGVDTAAAMRMRDAVLHDALFSAGLAARTVVLGMPLELFYAYPFQRPDEDAVFGVRIGGGG